MVNIDQTEVDRLSTLEQVKSIEEDMLMTPDVMEKPSIEKGEEETFERYRHHFQLSFEEKIYFLLVQLV
jgi:hypothetical protein